MRESIVRDDVVDCIVTLPPQLFFTTPIPVCLWFLDREKGAGVGRDRRGEVLFIDAHKLGKKISKTQITLTDDEIRTIVRTYHSWRGEEESGSYVDVAGFCRATTLDDIDRCQFALTP